MGDQKISLYRVLNPELIEKIGFQFSEYSFYYTNSDSEKFITKKDDCDADSIEIPGKNSQWDPSINDLIIKRQCSIKDTSVLFDFDDGIANTGAELGLAVILFSRDSSQRKVYVYPGIIDGKEKDVTFSLRIMLPAHTVRKEIELRTVLYLKKRSDDDSLSYYSNTEGFVYGVLSHTSVYFEEQSPEFPTRTAKLGSKDPLWKLEINWSDPRVDRLEDTVRIVINEAYPGYNDIWGQNADERKKQALKIEIYSSAILMVIEKVRDNSNYWKDTVEMNLNTLQDGSVCDYLCNIFNIIGGNSDDTHIMAYNIRKKLGEFR